MASSNSGVGSAKGRSTTPAGATDSAEAWSKETPILAATNPRMVC
nr:hypothetical protein [Oscillatoria sp. FACHB-1407]